MKIPRFHPSFRWLLAVIAMLLAFASARAATIQVQVGGAGPFFDPDTVSIHSGDTVEWIFPDNGFSHTVTSGKNGTPDGLFESGLHAGPFTFSYTFQNAGRFDYFCKVHLSMGMVGTVNVTDAQAPPPAQLLNISTRMRVQTGENVMIGGFIVTGTVAKKVLVRAIGPSLSQAGVADVLSDPTLELRGAGGSLIALNNDWKQSQQAEIEATTVPPKNDLESAIVASLPANNAAYTATVKGVNDATGVGLVEVYDLDQAANSKLANISTRGFVQTGSNVMIGGFILGNASGAARVVARGIGPSLGQAGVSGALADPILELRDANGSIVRSNDNWKETQQAELQATGIAPTNDLESALIASLTPGSYTAIVSGKSGGTGVGLVELYNLQ